VPRSLSHNRNQWRHSLFLKYFVVLFIAVGIPLFAKGVSDAWFGYHDQRGLLNARLRTEAALAASKIDNFLVGIKDQLKWGVRQDWSLDSQDQHRFDALGVLRQVPAVISITLVDGDGIEQLYVSRIDLNRIASGVDRSRDPAVVGAQSTDTWYGPVIYYQESEPFMAISVAGNRRSTGIAIAEINLKLIWNVVSAIQVGQSGHAFVLDQQGRLIAHPDISLVLSGTNNDTLKATRKLWQAIEAAGGEAITSKNTDGESVITVMTMIPGVNWAVFVEQPLSEAFAPIYAALWRTAILLLAGIALASSLAYWLAQRMTGPIRMLEDGTRRIGAGQFDHRIEIATGDEFERLANRFNQMSGDLAVSQERSERIARLKLFLAPQVAELVEKAGDENLLASQRAEVVVAFCDLRGFTAFSVRSEPDEIMQVLGDYYEALGSVITRYEATLTSYTGDGLMVLINAPVPCAEPAVHAVEMAIDMQKLVQNLISDWCSRGYVIGFGVGLAMGPATVGRIGYADRIEYTAVGKVVNLASRICSSAEDGQILIDQSLAKAVRDKLPLVSLGKRRFKGFDEQLAVYSIVNQLVYKGDTL
jgi:adenylate cyclase